MARTTGTNKQISKADRQNIAQTNKTVQKAPGKIPKVTPEEAQTPVESLAIAMKLANLPTIDTNNEQQVAQRTQEYFQMCVQFNNRASVAGYALALGTNRQTLLHWVNDKGAKPEKVRGILQRYFAVFEATTETALLEGQSYPLSVMFLAKNNLGYKDKQEINITAPDIQPTVEQMQQELQLLAESQKDN